MRIKEISLKNFKRFTDLTIKDIPESAKLVLLIGANGSGKSSVFDAFDGASNKGFISISDPYYKKVVNRDITISIKAHDNREMTLVDGKPASGFTTIMPHNSFYGRSSIRIVPEINRAGKDGVIEANLDRPDTFIQPDLRFNEDVTAYLKSINEPLRDRLFKGTGVDNSEILKEFISPLNNSLSNILGEDSKRVIQLIGLKDAGVNEPPNLVFRKGDAEITYDLLSHGEKQVVILLLNFIVRNKYYQDTIYFIDEMDTHLETSIQQRLLKDVVEKWIPNGSQLWTASHALGFIEYANKNENSVILDFDSLDFDVPQVIVPQTKYNSDVYDIAVSKEFLPSLFKGFDIVFVENTDKDLYAEVLIEKTLFIAEKNRDAVYHKVKEGAFKGIVDRDFLSDSDMIEIRKYYPNLRVLDYYSIENYLYHPDNVSEYFTASSSPFDKEGYVKAISDTKAQKANDIVLNIKSDRSSYAYFGEPKFTDKDLVELRNRFKNTGENETQTIAIRDALMSDKFEMYYPHFSMKKYKGAFSQLANIKPIVLAQTNWFKKQIQQLLS